MHDTTTVTRETGDTRTSVACNLQVLHACNRGRSHHQLPSIQTSPRGSALTAHASAYGPRSRYRHVAAFLLLASERASGGRWSPWWSRLPWEGRKGGLRRALLLRSREANKSVFGSRAGTSCRAFASRGPRVREPRGARGERGERSAAEGAVSRLVRRGAMTDVCQCEFRSRRPRGARGFLSLRSLQK